MGMTGISTTVGMTRLSMELSVVDVSLYMNRSYPTEAQEAATLVAYLRVKGFKFWHTPNETGSSDEARRRAIRIKREGGSKGFPDYGIIIGSSLLFVELKRVKGSKTSPEQLAWIQALNEISNVEAIIAYGAQDAIEFINKLLSNSPSLPDTRPYQQRSTEAQLF